MNNCYNNVLKKKKKKDLDNTKNVRDLRLIFLKC